MITQTSQETVTYTAWITRGTISSSDWQVMTVEGTPGTAAVLTNKADYPTHTEIMLSGLAIGCKYELRVFITLADGQVRECDKPYIIRCDR